MGNFAVSPVDHKFKERYRVKCMHRYCDDSVMLARTKAEARFLLTMYNRESAELGLVVKANSFFAPIREETDGGRRRHRKRKRGKGKTD